MNEGKVDVKFLETCKKFLGLVMLRRVKDSPGVGLNLPPKREIALSVPLSDLQNAYYSNVLTGAGQLLSDGFGSPACTSDGRGSHEEMAILGHHVSLQHKRKGTGSLLMEFRKVCRNSGGCIRLTDNSSALSIRIFFTKNTLTGTTT